MVRERFFLFAFIIAVLLFFGSMHLIAGEFQAVIAIIVLHLAGFFGLAYLAVFARRWWKGVPQHATWRDLAIACIVLGTLVSLAGLFLVIYGIVDICEFLLDVSEFIMFFAIIFYVKHLYSRNSKNSKG